VAHERQSSLPPDGVGAETRHGPERTRVDTMTG
jgi:hypothetical protein